MKFENLVTDIKSRVLPAYFAKGEDSFLLSKTAELISKACGEEMKELNQTLFNDENFSVNKMLESCEQFPIIDNKRFVFVSNVSAKLSDKDKKAILDYLEKPTESTCLLISASNENQSWDFIKNKAEEVDCKKASISLAIKFTVSEAKKHNKQISEKAATDLVKACSSDLFLIKSQMHILSSYFLAEPVLQSEHIALLIQSTNDWAVFELSEAIASKQADKTWQMIYSMMQEKRDSTFSIISMVSNHFRRLLYAAVSPLPASEVASLLNVKEFAITKARQQKNQFSPLVLKKIVDICCDVEFSIKSGKMSAENALSFFVVKLLGA